MRDRTSTLFSTFAVIRPLEIKDPATRSRLGVVGRYDRFRIDTDADAYNEFVIAGLLWDLTSRVSLALDYQGMTPRNNPTGAPTRSWFLHWVANF